MPQDDPKPLPDLHEEILSADQVRQLFADIAEHAELIEIGVRGAVPDVQPTELDEARTIVETRAARGVQLRYRYQGAQWWDTLMIEAEGVRLIRIQHEMA